MCCNCRQKVYFHIGTFSGNLFSRQATEGSRGSFFLRITQQNISWTGRITCPTLLANLTRKRWYLKWVEHLWESADKGIMGKLLWRYRVILAGRKCNCEYGTVGYGVNLILHEFFFYKWNLWRNNIWKGWIIYWSISIIFTIILKSMEEWMNGSIYGFKKPHQSKH